ncbi:hypothetical protein [Clostridium algidicarnis]|uniref:hypothetical protein n=1 Tax=Clostridium algidicarnis TaxID=37659 RepID=UPI001C0E03AC|nr:hypothetical protein [Clostridium algidicarnis]MBU3195409.1 hypothetical protein [Clostridium algidicarnis]MBU3227400.1 hypothetical protein [Clostridium algidicarnis]MBU3251193.1 hypothetical protein [Clostridium algidicarnis]
MVFLNEGKAESIHFTQLYFNLEKKDSGSNTMGFNGDEEGPARLLSLNYNKLLNLLNN